MDGQGDPNGACVLLRLTGPRPFVILFATNQTDEDTEGQRGEVSCPVRARAATQLSLLPKLHVQMWGMPEFLQAWEHMLGLFSQSGHLGTLLVGEELC